LVAFLFVGWLVGEWVGWSVIGSLIGPLIGPSAVWSGLSICSSFAMAFDRLLG
jgi:hypothetical protein